MNIDSTVVGKPYSRIESISIKYPAPNSAIVKFTEREYVLLADGTHRPFGSESTSEFAVNEADLMTTAELLDIPTGNFLGAQMTYAQVMLGIYAIIRGKQLEL